MTSRREIPGTGRSLSTGPNGPTEHSIPLAVNQENQVSEKSRWHEENPYGHDIRAEGGGVVHEMSTRFLLQLILGATVIGFILGGAAARLWLG